MTATPVGLFQAKRRRSERILTQKTGASAPARARRETLRVFLHCASLGQRLYRALSGTLLRVGALEMGA